MKKITIHITHYFSEKRIKYLNLIIDETNNYELECDIFIHTNKNDVSLTANHGFTIGGLAPTHLSAPFAAKKDDNLYLDNKLLKELKNGKLNIIYHDLTNIDPFLLTWKCRDLLYQQRNNYDIFMYIEDDILVSWNSIKYWLKYKNKLVENNYNLGFLRIEVKDNEEYILDLEKNKLSKKIEIENENYYINDINPYCAFWIYDQKEFNRFVNSILYNPNNIKDYGIREKSAIGLHGLPNYWYKETLIPVDNNNDLIEYCKIYHLDNNYVNDKIIIFQL